MINKNLKASEKIEINSSVESVWNVLINPIKIKQYLFGTETITDWQVGSSIIFQGEYNGHQYRDKGNVLKYDANKVLKYNYWSGFSGLEDQSENYSIITYQIEAITSSRILFTWTQEGFANEEGQNHSKNSLKGMLEQIKSLAEEG